jgi:hypothetical protein
MNGRQTCINVWALSVAYNIVLGTVSARSINHPIATGTDTGAVHSGVVIGDISYDQQESTHYRVQRSILHFKNHPTITTKTMMM